MVSSSAVCVVKFQKACLEIVPAIVFSCIKRAEAGNSYEYKIHEGVMNIGLNYEKNDE